jgi:hypothetical protein
MLYVAFVYEVRFDGYYCSTFCPSENRVLCSGPDCQQKEFSTKFYYKQKEQKESGIT